MLSSGLLDKTMYGVWGVDASIRRWDGATWDGTTPGSPTTNTLYGVWGTDVNNIYIVGDWGTILHKTR